MSSQPLYHRILSSLIQCETTRESSVNWFHVSSISAPPPVSAARCNAMTMVLLVGLQLGTDNRFSGQATRAAPCFYRSSLCCSDFRCIFSLKSAGSAINKTQNLFRYVRFAIQCYCWSEIALLLTANSRGFVISDSGQLHLDTYAEWDWHSSQAETM